MVVRAWGGWVLGFEFLDLSWGLNVKDLEYRGEGSSFRIEGVEFCVGHCWNAALTRKLSASCPRV